MSESKSPEDTFVRCARLLLGEIKNGKSRSGGRAELLAMDDEALRAGAIVLLREILDHLNEFEVPTALAASTARASAPGRGGRGHVIETP